MLNTLRLTRVPSAKMSLGIALLLAVLFVGQAFGNPPFASSMDGDDDALSSSPYSVVDQVINDFMDEVDARAATVAISRNGEILYQKGFGNPRERGRLVTEPDAIFRIASVSKPITATLVKLAVEDGKLELSDKLCDCLDIDLAQYPLADERWADITISHLLDHKGGWDMAATFDPMFRTDEIKRELRIRGRVQPEDVLEYMLERPLQFDPGERTAYSNFGYSLMGRVLEMKYEKSFGEILKEQIVDPLNIERLGLAYDNRRARPSEEVSYPDPADQFSVEVMDANGGMAASAESLCLFMAQYWMSGDPRLGGQYGEFIMFGSFPGTTAMAWQRPDRLDVVVLLNNRRDRSFVQDNKNLQDRIGRALDGLRR